MLIKMKITILTIIACTVQNTISLEQNADVKLQYLSKLANQLAETVDQVQKLKSEIEYELGLPEQRKLDYPSYRNSTVLHGVGIDADPSKTYDATPYFKNCLEVYKSGRRASGIYIIQPDQSELPFEVLCDMDVQGGGWTHIQKRVDGRTDFYRGWRDYRFGFGSLVDGAEFWLGLQNIYKLTDDQVNELLVEIVDRKGQKAYALYKNFAIGREEDAYPLKTLNGYSGDAGDSLAIHLGMKFSTFDFDQDKSPSNCAEVFKGAWWYNNCHYSNLNGKYINVDLPAAYAYQGISWRTFGPDQYCHARARMLIRPGSFEE